MRMVDSKPIKLMRPHYSGEELDLVREVLESEHLVDGPMTREFERLITEYVGTKHAIACTSATTGLEMALRALGVGPGDEVIIPDFTHPATGLVILAVGATPVIVDVDLKTFNTTTEIVQEAVTKRTKAILPVSWGGHPLQMSTFKEFCEHQGLWLIEDAACSLGTSFDGIPTGRLADITAFSFHPRKLFATGDGGCLTTNNDEWADYLRSYKAFGMKQIDGRPRFVQEGTNFRFSSILAAVGVGQLRHIDKIISTRIEKAQIYNSLLSEIPGVKSPYLAPKAVHNYQSYCVFLEVPGKRDFLLTEMRKEGIEVQIGTHAIHREPVFRKAKTVGSLYNSKKLADQLLALPLHHSLTTKDQERITEKLDQLLSASVSISG